MQKNYSKNKSDNKINQCGTKIKNSDKECRTACTITDISHNKNNSNRPDDNMAQINTTKSTDIINRHDFTVPGIENLTDQNI